MPLMLVPYSDAMRFGMGYNSYTQTMCIDDAVEAPEESTVTSENPPQKVSYLAKAIERVSDLVDEMDISRAATIQSGSFEVHGISNALDGAQIEDADISLMISMKVFNQTATLKASAPFKPIDSLVPGSSGFIKAFGDSYVSGFVRGGYLVIIIPFSCSNLECKEDLIQRVKQVSFSRIADLDKIARDIAGIRSIDSVKTAMPIVLTSCGQMKDEVDPWDINSVIWKAGDFPSSVAANPRITWAILTKYEANRGFNEWSARQASPSVDYGCVASFTSVLFDNYMQYKCLSRKVQHIISNRDQYGQVDKPRAIPVDGNSLLAVRDAVQSEMNKIVEVVNVLAQQPDILPKESYINSNSKDKLVQSIINRAIYPNISEEESPTRENGFPSYYSPSETSGGFEEIHTPQSSDADSASISGRSAPFLNKSDPFNDLKLRLFIPPEVWAELLPVKVKPDTANRKKVKKFQKLEIIAAVCGIHDVTEELRGGFVGADQNGHRLTLHVENIKRLEDRDSSGDFIPRQTTSLSIAYKYTDGPVRVCSVEHNDYSFETFEITTKSKHPRAQYHSACTTGLRILCVIYGGKIYNDFVHLERFAKHADRSNPGSWPRIQFNKDTVGDELLGKPDVTGVVFYEYQGSSATQAAVSLGGAGCLLIDQRQLAILPGGTTNGVPNQATKEDNKKVKPHQIILGEDVKPAGLSCAFEPGTLIRPSESPFLQFDNGVKFIFQKSGTFEVLNENNEVLWGSGGVPDGQSPGLLEFGKDGRLRLWTTGKHVYWSPFWLPPHYKEKREGKMVLSSQSPYLEVFNSRCERLWST